MKITARKLKQMGACQPAIDWVKTQNTTEAHALIELAMADNEFNWCNWFLTKIMDHEQQIRYAIYIAELVIDIYKNRYQDNNIPRIAIDDAQKYLKTKDKQNAKATKTIADAAFIASYSADTIEATTSAIYIVANANNDATHAIATAAYRAYMAAINAYGATYAANIKQKCIDYALNLLSNQL